MENNILVGMDLSDRISATSHIVNEARRKVNTELLAYVNGEIELYNPEDLKRLLSHLERAHDHLVTALLSDNDIYCALKHLVTAEGLIEELTDWRLWQEVGQQIVGALGFLSAGKLKPCSACKKDRIES